MSVLSKILSEKRTHPANPENWLLKLFGGGVETYTGEVVTEENAMKCSAVFGCVRIISESVASLPLFTYERLEPRGKRRATNHYLYPLLHRRPNPEMSALNYIEAIIAHICLWGNSYSEIVYRANTGQVKELWPLLPNKMRVERKNKQLRYIYTLPDNTIKIMSSEQVLHIPGLAFNGLTGLSPIGYAREAIGLALGTEKFGAKFFGNGARPGGVLEHPGELTDPAWKRLSAFMQREHSGIDQAHRLMILEEGMKYHSIGIPPEDAQFLSTREFQIAEIARIFKVPLHLLQEHSKSTTWGSGIKEMNIGFLIHTLRPYLVRIEQAISCQLIPEAEQEKFFAEFLVEALLRGDTESRYKAYATGKQWGWLNTDDIRELENMNPLPDEQGQDYWMPMNMVPMRQLLEGGMPPQEPPVSQDSRSETRNKNPSYAVLRGRTANSYKSIFRDIAARIIRREQKVIISEAKKQLRRRSLDTFLLWLEEFYRGHAKYVRLQIAPAITAVSEAVSSLAAEEVGLEFDDTLITRLQKFTQDYIGAYTYRHNKSSEGQLKKVIREAVRDNRDIVEALEERFDHWEEQRIDQTADNETVQCASAVAKFMFAAAGVTKLRWVAIGADSCPYCREMHGKIVSIQANFLDTTDRLEAEGKDGPLSTYRPVGHPPLHRGCVCSIEPE